ncbi:MAG: CHAD domain-containing protein [Candidatus Brocadiia bacterium]|jgi:CHAD domain-containing protein
MKGGDHEDFRRLAAEAVLKNLKALAAQIPGVRARRGSEPVHDLRVASRRVRTALRLLDDAAPSKRYRRWDRELKRLASALSRARDTDVQADFLREFLKAHRDARLRPGIRGLLLRLRDRRGKQQVKVLKELDRFVARGTLRKIRREFQRLKKDRRRAGRSLSGFAVAEKPADAAGPILKRLDQMLAYEPFIARPERRKELHRMRIAAKHCRYTMEAFAPRYGGRLAPWIRAMRQIQTGLGEIHDCDVWIHEALPKFLARERARPAFAEISPGIAALLRDRRRRRSAIYRAFLRRWKELRRKKLFERLAAERMTEGD